MEQKCAICQQSAAKSCSSCLSVAYCSAEHQKQHWKVHKKECSYYKIVNDPDLGKGFVATRDIKEGTIILEEAPAVFSAACGLSCITCGLTLPLEKLRQCRTCYWPVCSLECSKMAIHADNECKIFTSKAIRLLENPTFPPSIDLSDFTRLIRACCLKKRDPEIYQQISELCSHYNFAVNDVKAQTRLDIMMPHLRGLDLGVEEIEMKKLLKIFMINCHNSTDYFEEGKCSATCLYIKASRMNHSCVPNCTWVGSLKPEFKIRVRTATPVKKGEPLTIAYYTMETLDATKYRQEKILRSGFRCKCARCLDPTELGTYSSAVGCSLCKPTGQNSIGYFLPENPLDLSSNACWKCNSCGSNKLASEILAPVEKLGEAVSEMFQESKIPHGSYVIEGCKSVVKKYSGRILHPNHWVIQNAERAVVDYFSDSHHHHNRLKKLEFAVNKYIVNYGTHLLAIQDKLSPGLTQHRAGLLFWVGGLLQLQGKHFCAKKKYKELVSNLEKAIGLQQEALRYFEGEFRRFDETHICADVLIHNIECASMDLVDVRAMKLKI